MKPVTKDISITIISAIILWIMIYLSNISVTFQYPTWYIGIFVFLLLYTFGEIYFIGRENTIITTILISIILFIGGISQIIFNINLDSIYLSIVLILIIVIYFKYKKKHEATNKLKFLSLTFDLTTVLIALLLFSFSSSIFDGIFVSSLVLPSVGNQTLASAFNLSLPLRTPVFQALLQNYNASYNTTLIASTALLGLYILIFITIIDKKPKVLDKDSQLRLLAILTLVLPLILLGLAIISSFKVYSYSNTLATYFVNPAPNSTVIYAAKRVFTAANEIQTSSTIYMLIALFIIVIISIAYLISKLSTDKEN